MMNATDYRNMYLANDASNFPSSGNATYPVQAASPPSERYSSGVGGIAHQIENFLCQQVRRLEDTIDYCQEILSRESNLRSIESQIDQQRQNDLALIEQETIRLAEAWLQLESEQRHAITAAPLGADLTAAAPLVNREQNQASREKDHLSREVAVRQFQQMRREIGKHVRRTR